MHLYRIVLPLLLLCAGLLRAADLKPLADALQQKLGADCKVVKEFAFGEDLLEIKPETPIHYKTGVPPSSRVGGSSELRGAQDFSISIFPMPKITEADYYARKSLYYKALEEFTVLKERLRSIPTRNLKPSGNDAQRLLNELDPVTPEDRKIVEEFKNFVPGYTRAESNYRTGPTHIFEGKLYKVSATDYLEDCIVAPEDLARAFLLERSVSTVLIRLP